MANYSIYRTVVSQLLEGQEQLPSLPTITWDIRRALSNPNTSVHQLAQLVARDPSLAALLLKHASSPLFHTGSQPQHLDDIINLGLYHSLKAKKSVMSLPDIQVLSGYRKLQPPFNTTNENGELILVVNGMHQIAELKASFALR